MAGKSTNDKHIHYTIFGIFLVCDLIWIICDLQCKITDR